MQIKTATRDELSLLIHGLRSMVVVSQIDTQKRLLKQLENELSTRYGVKVAEPA
jgi:hypothetical protein